MKIGVLGTGAAGQTVAAKFVAMGHDVVMGARAADNDKVLGFARRTGGKAGTFADAAAHGEMVFNCTRGDTSLATLSGLSKELDGKILVDVANPLDFSAGFPPHLTVSNTDSLAEQIQRALPKTFVVKSLNTVNAAVMIEPSRVPGRHTVFVSGNDAHAKGRVQDFLRSLGWQSIIDLGDITSARAAEQLLPLWVRLYAALGNTADFNIAVVKA
jgi:predicted dinucleotide-binding enzyme